MVHPYRQDQRRGSWTRFGDMKLIYYVSGPRRPNDNPVRHSIHKVKKTVLSNHAQEASASEASGLQIFVGTWNRKHMCEPVQVHQGWHSRWDIYRQHLPHVRIFRLWVLQLGPASKQHGSGKSWTRPLDWRITQHRTTNVLLLGVARKWNTSISDCCATND